MRQISAGIDTSVPYGYLASTKRGISRCRSVAVATLYSSIRLSAILNYENDSVQVGMNVGLTAQIEQNILMKSSDVIKGSKIERYPIYIPWRDARVIRVIANSFHN